MENKLIQERFKALKMMDFLVRCANDEEDVEVWFIGGIPDGADDEELMYIAEDEAAFKEITGCFLRRMQKIAINGIYIGGIVSDNRD